MTQKDRLVVFDWNGTLYDDAHAVLVAQNDCLGHMGLDSRITQNDMEAYDHFPLAEYFQRFGLREEVFLERSAELFACFWETYNRLEHKGGIHLRAGTRELLDNLSAQGVTLAVLSNKGHDALVKKLDDLNLTGYFAMVDGVASQASTIQKLTKPDRLQAIVNTLSFEPSRCVMIGDSTEDIRAGSHIGIPGIGILGGVGGAALLQSANPYALISHFTELPTVLERCWPRAGSNLTLSL